ncbi:hypothetical protein EYF80_026061 [Liparis tanakae]|uniref:Uncharacterized protein n=1 Tax=Liparis tanakae TaxID=230148 RepID=A0A4Z2HFQ0_9TELE|nr:hypothetical protein EYF80_026061 [Liparis tanakae]
MEDKTLHDAFTMQTYNWKGRKRRIQFDEKRRNQQSLVQISIRCRMNTTQRLNSTSRHRRPVRRRDNKAMPVLTHLHPHSCVLRVPDSSATAEPWRSAASACRSAGPKSSGSGLNVDTRGSRGPQKTGGICCDQQGSFRYQHSIYSQSCLSSGRHEGERSRGH